MNQKTQISFLKNRFFRLRKINQKFSYEVLIKLFKIMKRGKEVILPVFAVIWNKTDAFSFKVSV